MIPKLNVVSQVEIIPLCAKTLRFYDPRLVDHGERVAFIADQITQFLPCALDIDRKELLLLSLFHDVGAYKTEEIDRMVEFETSNVLTHSAYGYLFLKYFSPISRSSKAILYHHMAHAELANVEPRIRNYAELIHLADRVDIALANKMPPEELLTAVRIPKFNPDFVDALGRALQAQSFCGIFNENCACKWFLEQANQILADRETAVAYLKMLIHSVDFISEATVTHSVNTTIASVYLAELIGLSCSEQERIYFAAMIHDIGKIAIPTEILESPGRLNDEEMAVMRTHVEFTEKIIQGILPGDITNIAVRHHEKLNGRGYPRGLKADQLTISDRIVAVADVISALSGRRSYKDHFAEEKIFSILRDMTDNGHLDPQIVKAALDHFEELQAEMKEHTAPIEQIYDDLKAEYRSLTGESTI